MKNIVCITVDAAALVSKTVRISFLVSGVPKRSVFHPDITQQSEQTAFHVRGAERRSVENTPAMGRDETHHSKYTNRCGSREREVHGSLHLREEDLVDRYKDELDEEANQAHGQKANQGGQADLLELCGNDMHQIYNKLESCIR